MDNEAGHYHKNLLLSGFISTILQFLLPNSNQTKLTLVIIELSVY